MELILGVSHVGTTRPHGAARPSDEREKRSAVEKSIVVSLAGIH